MTRGIMQGWLDVPSDSFFCEAWLAFLPTLLLASSAALPSAYSILDALCFLVPAMSDAMAADSVVSDKCS